MTNTSAGPEALAETTPEEIAAIAKIAEQVRWQVISDTEWRPKNALEASAVAGLLVDLDAATERIETEEGRADAARRILTNAATILREIAVENDVLVAARTWEHDNTVVAQKPVPSDRVADLRARLAEMREAATAGVALTIDVTELQDIETTLEWFNATRNALVHMHKNQLDYQLYGVQLDARSVESQFVHSALVSVMQEAAERGVQPTTADLNWVLAPIERLRNGTELDFVPPLARSDAEEETAA